MDKAELRRAVIARRDALDLDLRAAKSAAICARLIELLGRLDAAAPHTVAIYAAMGSEVDPAAFAAAAVKRGWRVAIRACSRQQTPQLVASACVCGQLLPATRTRLRLSPTPRGPLRPRTSTAAASLSCLPKLST